ncbi:Phospholipid methyltransferase [uncultured archaeon]|nr:Phospholipid methyltransferase [uncultured archaeon]
MVAHISRKKIPILFVAALLAVAAFLFLPAGTLDYWQAWAYMAVIFLPAFFVIFYFLKSDPGFIERRMQYKEKEAKQKTIVKAASILFLIGFIVPGLDRRFGWSHLPAESAIAADIIVFLGYLLCIWVFKENRYASRTVRVEKGQTVVSTGPYAMVRHPMYLGSIALYLATPIALGSYLALPFFALSAIAILFRILDEERLLKDKLPGYAAYCKKTRYRLVPYIW